MTLRRSRGLLFLGAICSALLLSSSAKAENTIITEPTDFWFEYSVPTQFIAQTFMYDGDQSDPQLWLYNEQGTLLVTNDDYNGLQSYISIEVEAGRYRLRAGTCCHMPDVWRTGGDWNLHYELAFNGDPASTTSLAPLPTTTLPPTTTTEPPQTTTTTSSTTTTTEVATTTTTTTTTTTSTLPPTTTVPQTVAPTTTTEPPTTTTSTTSTTTTTTTTVPATTTTTTVPVVIPPEPTPEEATELATDPEVLAEVTAEEATQIFEALVVDDLSEEQLTALVAAVQDAPTAVRESFEAEVNVFGGGVDTYVPIGSTVPVKTRRALIVMNLMSSVMVMPVRRK